MIRIYSFESSRISSQTLSLRDFTRYQKSSGFITRKCCNSWLVRQSEVVVEGVIILHFGAPNVNRIFSIEIAVIHRQISNLTPRNGRHQKYIIDSLRARCQV